MQNQPKYDVFVSYSDYSESDMKWVRAELLPRLEAEGLRVLDEFRLPSPGGPITKQLEYAVYESRKVLIVITPAYMQSEWAELVWGFAMNRDPSNKRRMLIPLLRELADLPPLLAGLTYVDFREDPTPERAWAELFSALRDSPQDQATRFSDKGEDFEQDAAERTAIPLPPSEDRRPPVEPEKTSEESIDKSPASVQVASRALSDQPSADDKDDLLGFSDYADALADFIKNPKTPKPLTLGIDAPWGMGKTTLMRMLSNRLAPKKGRTNLFRRRRDRLASKTDKGACLTVWFDAWKYDREESLWAALVLEILTQVREKSGFWQRLWISLSLNWKRVDWRRFFESLLKRLLYLAGTIGFGLLLYTVLGSLVGAEIRKKLLDLWQNNTGALLGGAGLVTLGYTIIREILGHVVQPFDLGINRYVSASKYRERIGFLAEFEDDFKRVVETVTRGGKRPLVVFIDDLDRCAPPKPAEIAEAINVLLDAKHCVFVIGMDAQAVACSIESRYKDLAAYYTHESNGLTLGQRFLEKIVQISFRIPQPAAGQINSFIVRALEASPDQPATQTDPEKVAEAERLIADRLRSQMPLNEVIEEIKATRLDLGYNNVERAGRSVYAVTLDDSKDVQDVILGIAPYLENNPRKIKRFVNLFRLQALIANRRGLLQSGEIRLDLLAKWAVLSLRWPEGVQSAINGEFRASAKRLDALFARPRSSDAAAVQQQEAEAERLMRDRRLRPIAESAQLRKLLRLVEYFGEFEPMQTYLHLMSIATSGNQ